MQGCSRDDLLGLNLFKFGWLIFKAGFWDFWGGQAPLFGFFCGHNAWAQWTCSSPCRSAARAATPPVPMSLSAPPPVLPSSLS